MHPLERRAYRDESDLELVKRYKESGDLEVLGMLYQRYTHLLFSICLNYLNEEESKDLIMDLYESLIHKVKKHEITNFKSWLHVSCKNACLMELRKRNKKGAVKEIAIYSMESDEFLHPIEEDLLNEDIDKLKRCMEKLKTEQARCVRFFYFDEMSYRQIAEETGFLLKKVKSYIQNAKRNLKICIETSE